jgi:hypothetical protein
MVKSLKNYTKRVVRSSSFQKEITVKFFELLLMIKLFHWKTSSHSIHKATDELYTKLNENMDKFIEILLGKTGIRINLLNKHNISLIDLTNKEQLVKKINLYKSYMVNLSNNSFIRSMSNTDLLNVRDEILGDLNQFLYLLTLD